MEVSLIVDISSPQKSFAIDRVTLDILFPHFVWEISRTETHVNLLWMLGNRSGTNTQDSKDLKVFALRLMFDRKTRYFLRCQASLEDPYRYVLLAEHLNSRKEVVAYSLLPGVTSPIRTAQEEILYGRKDQFGFLDAA